MPDGFYHVSTSPAGRAAAVTPSDSTTFDPPARSLYVGGSGNVVVDTPGGDTDVTFSSVPAGTVLPVQATKVKAATTATTIVRLW